MHQQDSELEPCDGHIQARKTLREQGSIKVTKHTNRTFIMHLFHILLRPFGPLMMDPPTKKVYPHGSIRLTPSHYAKRRCNIQERQVEGIWLYDLTAKDSQGSQEKEDDTVRPTFHRRIYYFCGGGFASPPAPQHWKLLPEICCRLPKTCITVISYPLIPNNTAEETLPQLLKLYRAVLAESTEAGESVIIAGDSSGGNIALGLTIAALMDDISAPKPEAIMVISPCVELMSENEVERRVEKNDPMLSIRFSNQQAAQWMGNLDRHDPRLSPLQVDPELFVKAGIKIIGVTGGYDILTPDAISLREKLTKAGVQGEWLEWDMQMHCFPLAFAYGLSECKTAVDWIVEALKRT